MRVKVVGRTDQYLILETSGSGLPPKRTTVNIDAIINGQTTLQEQKALARADGQKRLGRLRALDAAIREDEG